VKQKKVILFLKKIKFLVYLDSLCHCNVKQLLLVKKDPSFLTENPFYTGKDNV